MHGGRKGVELQERCWRTMHHFANPGRRNKLDRQDGFAPPPFFLPFYRQCSLIEIAGVIERFCPSFFNKCPDEPRTQLNQFIS